MVHDEVPCDEPSISENGKVSREKCFKDLNIKKAVLTGVEWYIFRSRLVKLFPDIPKIVQAALNCVASIAEGDFKKHPSTMIIVLALYNKICTPHPKGTNIVVSEILYFRLQSFALS